MRSTLVNSNRNIREKIGMKENESKIPNYYQGKESKKEENRILMKKKIA